MTHEKEELPPLETLKEDVITLISSWLDKTDESQEIKNNRRRHFSIFRSKLIQTNRILAKLAQYAAEGNVKRVASLLTIRPDLRIQVLFTLAGLAAQDEMEVILKEHPEDLLVKAPLHDISGAEFESISVFQHAIWTKDVRYMATMMLDCLPQNATGEKIRRQLVDQYQNLIQKGVVYQLKRARREKERHFNLDPLITALSDYKEKFNGLSYLDRKSHWGTVIGGAQALIPAHIRHHYCDPVNFFGDKPNFSAPQLKRSLEILNFDLNKKQMWTESLVELGRNLGIASTTTYSRSPVYALAIYGVTEPPILSEIEALRDLDNKRTTIDLPALIERLHTPIQNLEESLNVECSI